MDKIKNLSPDEMIEFMKALEGKKLSTRRVSKSTYKSSLSILRNMI